MKDGSCFYHQMDIGLMDVKTDSWTKYIFQTLEGDRKPLGIDKSLPKETFMLAENRMLLCGFAVKSAYCLEDSTYATCWKTCFQFLCSRWQQHLREDAATRQQISTKHSRLLSSFCRLFVLQKSLSQLALRKWRYLKIFFMLGSSFIPDIRRN